jgi:hypothetical protein
MQVTNTPPYYDDYNQDKKFYRILFNPGRPVQARELTQLQSILQEQIKRHGNHIFQNGTVIIPGAVYFDSNWSYVKLAPFVEDVSTDMVIDSMVGKKLYNSTGVSAEVIFASKSEGVDPPTLFVKYISSGDGGTIKTFSDDEALSSNDSTPIILRTATTLATGVGCGCSIGDGIFYVNGFFINVSQQSIVLSKYDNKPTINVGLSAVESIVTAEDDPSLYDNSLGFNNRAAPGADRYKIDLQLVATLASGNVEVSGILSFIDIMHIEDGDIVKLMDNTEYAEINKMIARRTSDESGDYLVDNFSIDVREHRNNDRGFWAASTIYLQGDVIHTTLGYIYVAYQDGLSSGVEPSHVQGEALDGTVTWKVESENNVYFNRGLYKPKDTETLVEQQANRDKGIYLISSGKAYVRGYEVRKQGKTKAEFNKSRKTDRRTGVTIPARGRFHVIVDRINGTPNFPTFEQLYMANAKGEVVGTSKAYSLEYYKGDIGTAAAQYRLFLVDVEMYSKGKLENSVTSFANVLSSDGKALDVVNSTFTCHLQGDPVAIVGTIVSITDSYFDGTSALKIKGDTATNFVGQFDVDYLVTVLDINTGTSYIRTVLGFVYEAGRTDIAREFYVTTEINASTGIDPLLAKATYIEVHGASGSGAILTPVITNGTITNVKIDNPGSGYGGNTVLLPKRISNSVVDIPVGDPGGNMAQFIVQIGAGQVTAAVTTPGSGYTSVPLVTVSGGGSPTRAADIKAMVSGYSVNTITVGTAGSGYTSTPTVTITGSSTNDDAVFTPILSGGTITNASVINGGSGYGTTYLTPSSAGGGTGAQFLPHFGLNGEITYVDIIHGGSGYTSSGTFSLVASGTNTGSGATITGTTSAGGVFLSTNVSVGGSGYKHTILSISAPTESGGTQAVAYPIISETSFGAITIIEPGEDIVGPVATLKDVDGATISGITLTPVVVDGGIKSVTIIDGGTGYSSNPVIGLVSTTDVSIIPTFTATVGTNGSIVNVTVNNCGNDFPVAPQLTITDSTGSGAILQAEIGNGLLQSITMTGSTSSTTKPCVIVWTGTTSSTSLPVATIDQTRGVITGIDFTTNNSAWGPAATHGTGYLSGSLTTSLESGPSTSYSVYQTTNKSLRIVNGKAKNLIGYSVGYGSTTKFCVSLFIKRNDDDTGNRQCLFNLGKKDVNNIACYVINHGISVWINEKEVFSGGFGKLKEKTKWHHLLVNFNAEDADAADVLSVTIDGYELAGSDVKVDKRTDSTLGITPDKVYPIGVRTRHTIGVKGTDNVVINSKRSFSNNEGMVDFGIIDSYISDFYLFDGINAPITSFAYYNDIYAAWVPKTSYGKTELGYGASNPKVFAGVGETSVGGILAYPDLTSTPSTLDTTSSIDNAFDGDVTTSWIGLGSLNSTHEVAIGKDYGDNTLLRQVNTVEIVSAKGRSFTGVTEGTAGTGQYQWRLEGSANGTVWVTLPTTSTTGPAYNTNSTAVTATTEQTIIATVNTPTTYRAYRVVMHAVVASGSATVGIQIGGVRFKIDQYDVGTTPTPSAGILSDHTVSAANDWFGIENIFDQFDSSYASITGVIQTGGGTHTDTFEVRMKWPEPRIIHGIKIKSPIDRSFTGNYTSGIPKISFQLYGGDTNAFANKLSTSIGDAKTFDDKKPKAGFQNEFTLMGNESHGTKCSIRHVDLSTAIVSSATATPLRDTDIAPIGSVIWLNMPSWKNTASTPTAGVATRNQYKVTANDLIAKTFTIQSVATNAQNARLAGGGAYLNVVTDFTSIPVYNKLTSYSVGDVVIQASYSGATLLTKTRRVKICITAGGWNSVKHTNAAKWATISLDVNEGSSMKKTFWVGGSTVDNIITDGAVAYQFHKLIIKVEKGGTYQLTGSHEFRLSNLVFYENEPYGTNGTSLKFDDAYISGTTVLDQSGKGLLFDWKGVGSVLGDTSSAQYPKRYEIKVQNPSPSKFNGSLVLSGAGVTGYTKVSGGSGYLSASVTVTGGGGSGATATITSSNFDTSGGAGYITGLNIVDAGAGYSGTPTIAITAPGGSGTIATLSIALMTGGIEKVIVQSPGAGYSPFSDHSVSLQSAKVQDLETNLVYQLPDSFVKTLRKQDNSVSVSYSVKRLIKLQNFSGNVIDLTAYPDETFVSNMTSGNYLVVDSNGGYVEPDTTTDSRNGTSTGISLNLPVTLSGNVAVIATVNKTNRAAREKQKLVSSEIYEINTAKELSQTTYTLPEADVFNLIKVTESGGPEVDEANPSDVIDYQVSGEIDVTSNYSLIPNVKNSYYDRSQITFQTHPKKPIRFQYEFFNHGEGDYACVNSFLIPYEQLPTQARDAIDFRPKRSDVGDFEKVNGAAVGEPLAYTSDITLDYEYYTARKDNIYLTSGGQFVVEEGTDKAEVRPPENSMLISEVSLAPYTKFADSNYVFAKMSPHRRYTMEDISKLDQRLSSVEYYTALTQTEKQTKDHVIQDSAGNDIFKNGFLVDTFADYSVGLTNHPDFACSLDLEKGELRPSFEIDNIKLFEVNTLDQQRANNNYTISGPIATLPYTEVPYITQLKASMVENVNPYSVYSFNGVIKLTPSEDDWFENRSIAPVSISLGGNYDAMMAMANSNGVLNTKWNSWQTNWTGVQSVKYLQDTKIGTRTVTSDVSSKFNGGAKFESILPNTQNQSWQPVVNVHPAAGATVAAANNVPKASTSTSNFFWGSNRWWNWWW